MKKSIIDAVLLVLFIAVSFLLLCALPASGQWSAVTQQGVKVEIASEYPYLLRSDVDESISALRHFGRTVCGHIQYEILETQDDLIWFRCKVYRVKGLFHVPDLYLQAGDAQYRAVSWLSVSGPDECGLKQFLSWDHVDTGELWHGDGYTRTWLAFKRVRPETIDALVATDWQ